MFYKKNYIITRVLIFNYTTFMKLTSTVAGGAFAFAQRIGINSVGLGKERIGLIIGVDIVYQCYEGVVHAFMSLTGGMSHCYEALDYTAEYLNKVNRSY